MTSLLTSVQRSFCAGLAATTFVSCASIPSSPENSFQRVAGKRIYGWVVVANEDGPADGVWRSPECVKRDALCLLLLQEARKFQYATVAVYGSYVFTHVLVPRDAGLRYTDIIQIDVPVDAKAVPVFVSIGARAIQRNALCNWVDGSDIARTGGVVCAGWTYKSLL